MTATELSLAAGEVPIPTPSQEVVRRCIESCMCPFCGRGPWEKLAQHTNAAHAVDRFQLRDMAGLTYQKPSICSPDYSESCRIRAVQLRKEGTLRSAGAPPGTPHRLSTAGKQIQRASGARLKRDYGDVPYRPKPGQSLAELFPDIDRQFVADAEGKGQTPETVKRSSAAKFEWKCERGHRWKARVADRTRRAGCPECNRLPKPGQSLAEKFPDIAKQFVADAEGKVRTPETVGASSDAKFEWECEFGHRWKATVHNRCSKGRPTGCPECCILRRSKPENGRSLDSPPSNCA